MARKRPEPVVDPRAGKSPAEQLRESLHRHKVLGVDFDDAWASAWSRVRWPHGREPREQWQAILTVGQPAWRAAYENAPEQRPHAVARSLLVA